MVFLKGIGCLLLALMIFSLFSMKAPKGDKAMSGLAGAAVATFLVEALFRYVGGDFFGITLLGTIGTTAGGMGGSAAAALVPLMMGANPIYAVVAGCAVQGFGILPGFIAGYAVYFLADLIDRKAPAGIDAIVGAISCALLSYVVASVTAPGVEKVIATIGGSILVATEQSPILMGFLLGGIMKVVCSSPLSSMALTAMLGLTGLPMGIASTACFGGAFCNGMVFHCLGIGNKGQVVAVMLEPLTQADLVTRNAVPLYSCNFFAGGCSGIVAVLLGIVNNAPGTASPIPGLLVPFAFNPAHTVIFALALSALCGLICGYAGIMLYRRTRIGAFILSKTSTASISTASAARAS